MMKTVMIITIMVTVLQITLSQSVNEIKNCSKYSEDQKKCLECDNFYFPDPLGKKSCLKCSEGCKKCNDTSNCTICSTGYFKNDNLCYPCNEKCVKCSSAMRCTECKDGFIRYDHDQCVKPNSDFQTLYKVLMGFGVFAVAVLVIVCVKKKNKQEDDSLYNFQTPAQKNKTFLSDADSVVTNKAVKFIARNREYKEDVPGPYVSSGMDQSLTDSN